MVLVPFHMLVSALFSVINMLRSLSQEGRGEAKRCSLHLSVATQVSTARHFQMQTKLAGILLDTLCCELVITLVFLDSSF